MIKLVPEQPLWRCPWCPKDPADGDRHFYTDSDNLQLDEALAPEDREPDGFYARVECGQCPFCEGRYYGASLTMLGQVAGDPGDSEVWDYLRLNRHAEAVSCYDAVHEGMGGLRWSVTSYATPFGIMLQHEFGPFAMREGYADILRESMRELWPDLRDMMGWADFLEKRPEA